jgi:hypothetical protein
VRIAAGKAHGARGYIAESESFTVTWPCVDGRICASTRMTHQSSRSSQSGTRKVNVTGRVMLMFGLHVCNIKGRRHFAFTDCLLCDDVKI